MQYGKVWDIKMTLSEPGFANEGETFDVWQRKDRTAFVGHHGVHLLAVCAYKVDAELIADAVNDFLARGKA